MPPSSFYRGYHKLESLLLEISQYKSEWQQQLVGHLSGNYGHTTAAAAMTAKRSRDTEEFQRLLWGSFQKAFGVIKTRGRPTNHIRAVRKVLLSMLAADVPSRLHYIAGDDMGVSAKDMRKFVSMLQSLESAGKGSVWFEARGAVRSDATSKADEAIAQIH